MTDRITVLVPARKPNGMALIAVTSSRDEPANIYLARRIPNGRWETWPMPDVWRNDLCAMGMNVPLIASTPL